MKVRNKFCINESGPAGKCGRELYDDMHCIFHSKDIEGKKEKFVEAFREEFEKQDFEDKGFYFQEFVFPNDMSFDSREFKKTVAFNNATFYKSVSFNNATFSDLTVLNGTTFKGAVNFNQAKFLEEVVANKATFQSEASFAEATFCEGTSFDAAEFCGNGYFKKSTFLKDASFIGNTFKGDANFRGAKFQEGAIFDQTKFSGESKFDNATFKDITKIRMTNTFFFDLQGLFEILEKKKIKRGIEPVFFSENINIFLGDKSAARYPIENRQIKDVRYLKSYRKKFPTWYYIWWLFTDCGCSFGRFACWSLGLVLFFTLIYLPSPAFFPDCWIDVCNKIGPQFQQTAEAYKGEPLDLLSSFYFSIVTFTTLGFGDVVAANWMARILVTIEVILGYVMLGGLISIFANKVARRS